MARVAIARPPRKESLDRVMQENVFDKNLLKDFLQSANLTPFGARFLVDLYYTIQKNRIRANNAIKAADRMFTKGLIPVAESTELLSFFKVEQAVVEKQIQKVLDNFTKQFDISEYLRSVFGIGVIISAGLLAHVNIEKSKTAGGLLRFAGQDPSVKWEKGQKRPYNQKLKTLCYHAGSSFIKFRGSPKDMYGKLYNVRRAYEERKNEAGDYAAQAAILAPRFVGKPSYSYYKRGVLPPAHIHARCRRWLTRIFISHFHDVFYFQHYGRCCDHPYVSILERNHEHLIVPPAMGTVPGFEEAFLSREITNMNGEAMEMEPVTLKEYYDLLADRHGVWTKPIEEDEDEDEDELP